MKRNLFFALSLVACAGAAPAQLVGSPLPRAALSGFTGSPATTLQEFTGRTVLIEFFSYW